MKTMKNMKKYQIYLGLLLAIHFTSCEDFLDVNKDPDSPTESEMVESAYLPGVVALQAFEGTGFASNWSSFWTLQMSNDGDAGREESFILTPAGSNDMWRSYFNSLPNAKLMMELAATNGNYKYQGIGQILTAYQYASLTDYFNEIPCTEAHQFPNEMTPVFDSQELVYTKINEWLDDGIANLGRSEVQLSEPAQDDLLFGGDIDKWMKFAYSLKARYALRLSYAPGKNAAAQADLALAALVNAMETNADNADFAHYQGEGKQNYWYQYQINWTQNYYLFPSIQFVEMMNVKDDPRRAVYFDALEDGSYLGLLSNTYYDSETNPASPVSESYLPSDRAQTFMSFVECKFIEAEAYVLKQEYANAESALTEAITADMSELGIADSDITTFIGNVLPLPQSIEAAQEVVINQKYLAMFIENSEPYHDYRRTGYPVLDIANNINNPAYPSAPVRLPYPYDEIQANGENVPSVNYVNDKVWWDNK